MFAALKNLLLLSVLPLKQQVLRCAQDDTYKQSFNKLLVSLF